MTAPPPAGDCPRRTGPRVAPFTSSNADVSVYTLMKLLGHESMTTSQRYVTAAGSETRSAAARNPLYALVPNTDLAQDAP